jgi:hypothetical protein
VTRDTYAPHLSVTRTHGARCAGIVSLYSAVHLAAMRLPVGSFHVPEFFKIRYRANLILKSDVHWVGASIKFGLTLTFIDKYFDILLFQILTGAAHNTP